MTARCQGKLLFVSDELPHYGTVLSELFHELIPLAPTGKPGRPRNPEMVIDADLAPRFIRRVRGGAGDQGRAEGSPWERAAHSRTIGAQGTDRPRSIRWLKAKFAICVACYNLIRPHETLSRGEDRIFRPKTPSMAANVTDHRWTFSELLDYSSLCQ